MPHAATPPNTLMEHFGWNEDLLRRERQTWSSGECVGEQRLSTCFSSEELRQVWNDAGRKAACFHSGLQVLPH
jgi:hypothetical protein